MNTLEQYMYKKSTKHGENFEKGYFEEEPLQKFHKESSFEEGFDAAIALDLPAKFAEWQINEGITYYNPDGKIGFPNSYFKKDNHSMDIETPQKLYQYWIENVYKPE